MRPYPRRQAMQQEYKAQSPRVGQVGDVGQGHFFKVFNQHFSFMSAVDGLYQAC